VERSYPSLLVDRPGRTESGTPASRFYLVAYGKRGAQDGVAGLDGRRVQLDGTLVYREDQTMIELAGKPVEALGDEKTPATSAQPLGSFTLVGEIVDSKCYLGVMKPGNLKPHRACAVRCISGGIPPVFLVRTQDGAALYLMLIGTDGRALNREILDMVAESIEITGEIEQLDNHLMFKAEHPLFAASRASQSRVLNERPHGMDINLAELESHYPAAQAQLPDFEIPGGRYVARFAQGARDLDPVLRLRYEVFNLELEEGLETSHATGLDVDVYDAGCHHLMILERRTGNVVGTYRMQTAEMAANHAGFYSADEFDFSMLPGSLLARSVELGRACVAREHRNGRVLYLLWKGLIRYLLQNEKRYLFGCSSLTSQDPSLGKQVMDHLVAEGYVHESLHIRPLPRFACYEEGFQADPLVPPKIPKLMRLYLAYDVKVCGPPAMDRLFKTIDYFTVFDVEKVSPRVRRALSLNPR
jgi:putative hemolysin